MKIHHRCHCALVMFFNSTALLKQFSQKLLEIIMNLQISAKLLRILKRSKSGSPRDSRLFFRNDHSQGFKESDEPFLAIYLQVQDKISYSFEYVVYTSQK